MSSHSMHDIHYGVLDFGMDVAKTVFGFVIVKSIGSMDLPERLHEWLACIVAIGGLVHIAQKMYYAHKQHKRDFESNNKEDEKNKENN